MKWMNFLPLLAWMLGFCWLIAWDLNNQKNHPDIQDEDINRNMDSSVKIYICGSLFWFILGLFLSL